MEIKLLLQEYALIKYPIVTNCRIDNERNKVKRERLIKRYMDLEVHQGFQRDQTDCRHCCACKEMILSDMYRTVIEIDGERIVGNNFVYCQNCYLEMIKE